MQNKRYRSELTIYSALCKDDKEKGGYGFLFPSYGLIMFSHAKLMWFTGMPMRLVGT